MRPVYFGLGSVFLALAGVGVLVPGMPTTIFCILALWAFKRSSPKMEAWLLNHPMVGSTLRDWEENKSIKPRTKAIAVTMLWAVLLASMAFASDRGRVILLLVGFGVSAYILTRRSRIQAVEPEGSESVPV